MRQTGAQKTESLLFFRTDGTGLSAERAQKNATDTQKVFKKRVQLTEAVHGGLLASFSFFFFFGEHARFLKK